MIKKKSYCFVCRDGQLFRHILNYLRDPQSFHLPADCTDVYQLSKEAEFYQLTSLVSKLTGDNAQLNYVELIETCHPEKIGVCSARLVLSEDLREQPPFSDVLEMLPKDHDEYQGISGRFWIRTETTRIDWGIKLKQHGWHFVGYTSLNRRLPDITGQGTDLCHIVEKWCKA